MERNIPNSTGEIAGNTVKDLLSRDCLPNNVSEIVSIHLQNGEPMQALETALNYRERGIDAS